MGWRLIDSHIADPYYVTAADDALATVRNIKAIPNTLHFYQRHPPAVSLGRGRKIHEDINLEECTKNDVKIIRRTTGGGTIYTDKDCLIYSLVFDQNDTTLSSSQEIFKDICNILVTTLEHFHIHAVYKPPNDLLLNGKKISGSAQIKKSNIILIHGTILVDTNLETMNTVLKHKKPQSVSSIAQETNNPPSIKEIKSQMITEYAQYFHRVPSGSNGGDATTSTWNTRTLNAGVSSDAVISRSGNTLKLRVGTYLIQAESCASYVGIHKIRLRDASGSTRGTGTSEWSNAANTKASLFSRVTVTTTTLALTLQHFTKNRMANTGLGYPTSTGEDEVYANVQIIKTD